MNPTAPPKPFYWETTGQRRRHGSHGEHREEHLSGVAVSPGNREEDPGNVTLLTVKGSEMAAEHVVGSLPATSVGDCASIIHSVSMCGVQCLHHSGRCQQLSDCERPSPWLVLTRDVLPKANPPKLLSVLLS